MPRQFHKMHGLGNDFVIFDARSEPLTVTELLARAVADRRTGIGCDQLIVLEPSTLADLRMRIFNGDGGEVESCGNASRCVVRLTGATRLETAGGVISGGPAEGGVEVDLGEPRFGWDEVPIAFPMDTTALPMAWGALQQPMALNVGNPHLVFFVPDVDAIDLPSVGPSVEHDPAFPERINVNVAQVLGDGSLKLRTWERGAGLTLACGTGASATAVAAIRSRRVNSPVRVTMPGGSLRIAWAPGEPVRMTGGATDVFRGEIELDGLIP